MSEYGIRTVGSSPMLSGYSLADVEEAARRYTAEGHVVEIVRVELVGTFRPGEPFAPISGACYACGKPADARSPHCPKASHP